MSKQHKHANEIHAFAEGAKIQQYDIHIDEWFDVSHPCFYEDYQYRVKPRTVKREGWVAMCEDNLCRHGRYLHARIYDSKNSAANDCHNAVDVIKIEWEVEE